MAYYFDAPATLWEETFPLGNGRIGLMPDGGVEKENYVLNEISMWSGSKQNTDNPNAARSLPEIRRLLFEGKNDEAQQLMYETFVCRGEGSGRGRGYKTPYGSYQLLGNLSLSYIYREEKTADVTGYRRELSLEEAIATVSFKKGKTSYRREAFTSFAADIAVIRLSADTEKALDFSIRMNRPERYTVSADPADQPDLRMEGRLFGGDSLTAIDGIRYGARVRVLLPKGGERTAPDDTTLRVKDASEAIVLVALTTDYFGKEVDKQLDALLLAAESKGYDELKSEHVASYRKLYDRVRVDFGHEVEKEKLPVNQRLVAFQQDHNDPSLMALYYQFGRYLLISSTRPGSLPPNLQGLWCNTINTPWNGDYHMNINVQMNLWPAESGNLTELHLPLIEWTKQQVPSGRHTAKVFYNARGWVTHILGNVWEFTAPGEHPSWGATNTSAAWMCAHLYNHYLYTKDQAYLSEVYPVMKEAALFFTDMLVENPRNRYLVTAPTTSPENTYVLPNGNTAAVCAGSTMDNQILRELFQNVIDAAGILGVDADFAETLAGKRASLMPTTIAPDGRIMEWPEPYEEQDPHHRHISHLYGLYPANEISLQTPDLAAAARKTLEVRGDASTGWSMAWKVNFWARLHDGEHAFKLLTDLLTPCSSNGFNYSKGGGTYLNLFCAHPPFQIDGNFGGCAGIAEMLIQSQNGFIEWLPALPAAWETGSFSGLRVQGGGEVSARWSEGRWQTVGLKAIVSNDFRIKLPEDATGLVVKLNGKSVSYPVIDGLLEVHLQADDELRLEL
ncbi:MAG: glycoside hydrolase N-terminal domain-containing protein, partial [Tannerella sp.]|jgi:alpha-L-fucosidase 2|nr:glycoside hydrolase N-terminal domain-containing protein [Tannerella sp.]